MKRTSISLPPELEEDVKELAIEHHRSMHGELIYLLGLGVKQERAKQMLHTIIVDKQNIPSVLEDLKKQGFEPDYEGKGNTMSGFKFINDLERLPGIDERVGCYRVFKDGVCIHDEYH